MVKKGDAVKAFYSKDAFAEAVPLKLERIAGQASTSGVDVFFSPFPLVRGLGNLVWSTSNNPTLIAIPFFILAGNLMNTSGITERIFRFARALVGHIWGGLGQVNVIASMIFSGMSGAAVADALNPQDGLYTLLERGAAGRRYLNLGEVPAGTERVSLRGRHLRWSNAPAELLVFDHALLMQAVGNGHALEPGVGERSETGSGRPAVRQAVRAASGPRAAGC